MEELEGTMLICDCKSIEHQIFIYYDLEDNQAYCRIHLVTYKNFFKRLWIGLKYAFGYKSKYGHWDEFIISNKYAGELKDLSDLLKRNAKF